MRYTCHSEQFHSFRNGKQSRFRSNTDLHSRKETSECFQWFSTPLRRVTETETYHSGPHERYHEPVVSNCHIGPCGKQSLWRRCRPVIPLPALRPRNFSIGESNIFWNITPCSLFKGSRRFGGTYRLHARSEVFTAVTMKTAFLISLPSSWPN
jgi:hypothetical protein